MQALRPAIAAIALVAIQLGGCGDFARPPRPPFHNYYGPHSDGRSPFSKWWLFSPHPDGTGASFRGDHELNLLLLHVGKDPGFLLNYADGRVFDERGYILLYQQVNGTSQHKSADKPAFGPISVPNTPDILATKNRLFAFNREGEWHDFAIPEGFAEDFEKDFDSSFPNQKVLVELERYAKQRELDDLCRWLKTQM